LKTKSVTRSAPFDRGGWWWLHHCWWMVSH